MTDKLAGADSLTPDDVQQARELIARAMPILARLAGLGPIQARSLTKIVLVEFDTFIAIPLSEDKHPDLLQGLRLAEAVDLDRRTLDEKYKTLGPALEQCAMAFAELLKARGDFLESTVYLLEETSSPVGDKASGDGIPEGLPEGKRFQRLYGLMLSGVHTHTHMTLTPPRPSATDVTYTEEIVSKLKMLTTVGEGIRELGELVQQTGADADLLAQFGVGAAQLRSHMPSVDLLIPILSVGRETDIPGKFKALSPDIDGLRRQLDATAEGSGVRRAVIEIPAQPSRGAQRTLTAAEMRNILGWIVQKVPLDLRFRPADIRCALEQRGGHTLLHRKVLRDDDNVETMLAPESTFVLLGFKTMPRQRILNEDLAYAIAGAELLAARTRAHKCAVRLGDKLAPGLTQVKTDAARCFVRCLRLISNIALTVVSEQRKRDERG
jgi:hypothetical protein